MLNLSLQTGTLHPKRTKGRSPRLTLPQLTSQPPPVFPSLHRPSSQSQPSDPNLAPSRYSLGPSQPLQCCTVRPPSHPLHLLSTSLHSLQPTSVIHFNLPFPHLFRVRPVSTFPGLPTSYNPGPCAPLVAFTVSQSHRPHTQSYPSSTFATTTRSFQSIPRLYTQ